MLAELVVENFYSFRDETTFSMVASRIAEHPETVTKPDTLSCCKISTIYGANASGKSNLLRALALIREGVFLQKGGEAAWLEKIQPFHLDARKELEDTLLEVSFTAGGQLYRYGFYTDRTEITEEYLYQGKGEQQLLFRRTKENGLEEGSWLGRLAGMVGLEGHLLLATLFTEVSPPFSEMALIQEWFSDVKVILDTGSISLAVSKAKLHLKKYKHNLLSLIQVADPSIHDLAVREVVDPESGELRDEFVVIKLKKGLDGKWVPHQEGFLFHDVESAGTVKLLALAGPVIEALETGGVLLVDEMDQSFHPLMTRYVLELFRGEYNQKGAQLVFSTHDISNLRSDLFRRDQVWFVEKREDGSSGLVSLVEYQFDRSERKNSYEFYRNYLNGKYGAVPFVPPVDWWVNHDEE